MAGIDPNSTPGQPMRSGSSFVSLREQALAVAPIVAALVVVAGAFWLASKYVEPAPPKRLVIASASAGSPYHRMAERYREFMARNGVTVVVQETTGSFENLSLLRSAGAGVQAGIVQGGIINQAESSQLLSLGRIATEPVWIFYRGAAPLGRLADLKGKRILVGPAGGGTNFLATRLLAASGVTAATATLTAMELPDYVEALSSGTADAGVLVLAAEARTIQRLFALPDLRLMSLAQADAFSQRFPFLTRVELKQGIVDLDRNVPAGDVAMVSTLAALVVRDDLHPALANLLTQAAIAVHSQPVVGPNGEAPIFQRAGDFPQANDPELALSEDARRVYKSGPPFLQRYLPFWLATFADRMAVMLLPILGVLLPALKLGPWLYTWQVRRRILHWYRELKRVERDIGTQASAATITEKQARVEWIEAAVNEIPIPLQFSNQHYDLRQHIDVVRRRLAVLSMSAS